MLNNFASSALTATVSPVPSSTLSSDDIKRLAPMVYATGSTNPDLSKKYTFASSERVIEDMKNLGWEVVSANQPHPRRHSINSYHTVSFQNNKVKLTATNENGEEVVIGYPRIILTNSHDGFTSFQFRVGMWRSLTNQCLVLASDEFNAVRLRHIHYTFEELLELVNTITTIVPSQVKIMNRMQEVMLTDEQKLELALAAIRTRSNNETLDVPEFILEDIVTPIRPEDNGNDVWTVYNIIMEKMMNGNFQINGKRGLRKARRINSIWKSIHLNQSMFKVALKYIAE